MLSCGTTATTGQRIGLKGLILASLFGRMLLSQPGSFVSGKTGMFDLNFFRQLSNTSQDD